MSSIGSISNVASAQLSQQVSTAVVGKVQDAAKAQGNAVTKLLQGAAAVANQSYSGSGNGANIDVHG